MFEKQSHVNTSISWEGCGAVWAQTPRKAKETDSSFALSCRLAEQAGPHQNRRPLQIFIISPLLTSLLIFPWNKRSHKVLIIPLSFHTFKSLGRDQNLILSDPRNWFLTFLFRGLEHLPLEVELFLSHSQPCWDVHALPVTGNIVFSSCSHTGQNTGKLQECTLHLEHGRALKHPTQTLLIMRIAIHLAPFSLSTQRITLELFFPDLFTECKSSFYWLFLRGIWRGWFHEQPPWIWYLRVQRRFPGATISKFVGGISLQKLAAFTEAATQLPHCIWGLLYHLAI